MSQSQEPKAFPGHDGGCWAPVECEIVATWDVGHFAENLVVSDAGAVFVTLHSHQRIDRWDVGARTMETFSELPAPVAGLAPAEDGAMWANGGELGQSPGRVWRIDASGNAEVWVAIDEALLLNGCTPLPGRGSLLVCDSMVGKVYAIDQSEPRWSTWIADERLLSDDPQVPGANGIKIYDGAVWISVTGRHTILRAPLRDDGTPGPLKVVAESLLADDFAFSTSGAMFIATHPAHTVMRLDADGGRTTLAGPDHGAVGSTACAFGRSPDDDALYVTTGGGSYQGSAQEAKLLRLRVGERGHPIPSP